MWSLEFLSICANSESNARSEASSKLQAGYQRLLAAGRSKQLTSSPEATKPTLSKAVLAGVVGNALKVSARIGSASSSRSAIVTHLSLCLSLILSHSQESGQSGPLVLFAAAEELVLVVEEVVTVT